jgi:hypothetical protein
MASGEQHHETSPLPYSRSTQRPVNIGCVPMLARSVRSVMGRYSSLSGGGGGTD